MADFRSFLGGGTFFLALDEEALASVFWKGQRPVMVAVRGGGVLVPEAAAGALMTLSKCVKLGLHVQSVVARVNFPHEVNSGLISNSRGTIEKALIVLLPATCKTIPRSCVPNSTEWLSSTRCECKYKIKYDMQYSKVNNNAIK
jgi:hypothetical protein